MKRILAAFLIATAAVEPAFAQRTTSQPLQSQAVYRLAWVTPGQYLRSGAVIVDGDHLASDAPADRAAVLAAYRSLKAQYGLGAVLNLRAESAEDQEAARALHLRYLHLPITDGAAPNPAQVLAFFNFLESARRQHQVALWHCAGGIGRTGVLAAMLRLRQGWSVEEAASEMFAMGLNYPQAAEHLPALNAFASALGKPTYYPGDWPFSRQSRYDYRAIKGKLPTL